MLIKNAILNLALLLFGFYLEQAFAQVAGTNGRTGANGTKGAVGGNGY